MPDLHHLTLTTGDVRASPRSEVAPDAPDGLRAALNAAKAVDMGDGLGIDLGRRAKRRSDAYYRGLDAAIDGAPFAPEADPYPDAYRRGHGDGLCQLAAFPFRPVTTNPGRDNG